MSMLFHAIRRAPQFSNAMRAPSKFGQGFRSFATSAAAPTGTAGAPVANNCAAASMTGSDHFLQVAKSLFRFTYSHPVPLFVGALTAYRISVTSNPDDTENYKGGSTAISTLRQARRNSLKDYQEAYYKKGHSESAYEPGMGNERDQSGGYYKRKGMDPGSTGVVKTNSFRPGGTVIAASVDAKRELGVVSRKSVGMYDSEGLSDASSRRPAPKLEAGALGPTGHFGSAGTSRRETTGRAANVDGIWTKGGVETDRIALGEAERT